MLEYFSCSGGVFSCVVSVVVSVLWCGSRFVVCSGRLVVGGILCRWCMGFRVRF